MPEPLPNPHVDLNNARNLPRQKPSRLPKRSRGQMLDAALGSADYVAVTYPRETKMRRALLKLRGMISTNPTAEMLDAQLKVIDAALDNERE